MRGLLFLLAFLSGISHAGTLYISTQGVATNSGSTDSITPVVNLATVTIAAAVIQFPIGTDLSSVVTTAGATQSSVYVHDAGNANKKIFWATAVNDGADTVTVDASPTGAATSSATIGGWHLLTNAYIEGSLRAGDTAKFKNSPASSASSLWTFRIAGDSASGPATIMGESGIRPVLTCTGTVDCVDANSVANVRIENLEIQQQGASQNAIDLKSSPQSMVINVKVSDSGSQGIISVTGSPASNSVIRSEVSGSGTDGITLAGTPAFVIGCNVHDNNQYGINFSGTSPSGVVALNTIDSNTNSGFILTSAGISANTSKVAVLSNTLYGQGDSGIHLIDTDASAIIMNNNSKDNGNVAGDANILKASGNVNNNGWGGYNVLNIGGALGGVNASGYTLDTTDLTTDPLFTDAPGADFSVGAASPAKGAGYPGAVLGGSTGYMDIGAIQRQESASSGAKMTLSLD